MIRPDPQAALFHVCNFDRVLLTGGLACTVCDRVKPLAGDEIDRKLELMETLVPPRDEIDEKLRLMEDRLMPRFFIGLHTTDHREVSGSGYARQAYPRDPGDPVRFPTASGSWGSIRAAAIYDENNTLLAEIDLSRVADIVPGDTLEIRLEGLP